MSRAAREAQRIPLRKPLVEDISRSFAKVTKLFTSVPPPGRLAKMQEWEQEADHKWWGVAQGEVMAIITTAARKVRRSHR
eukprot:9479549-Pyramimonas_sp.AAC.2